ncbi:unnamed protein product [Brugia timori]|uniref:Ovule protein n=1 Tax=Brugia timori TaxID=42155 RepID=A0A0R3QIA8_9BILA|nr:unnamed protein product [Brugia timori]
MIHDIIKPGLNSISVFKNEQSMNLHHSQCFSISSLFVQYIPVNINILEMINSKICYTSLYIRSKKNKHFIYTLKQEYICQKQCIENT